MKNQFAISYVTDLSTASFVQAFEVFNEDGERVFYDAYLLGEVSAKELLSLINEWRFTGHYVAFRIISECWILRSKYYRPKSHFPTREEIQSFFD